MNGSVAWTSRCTRRRLKGAIVWPSRSQPRRSSRSARSVRILRLSRDARPSTTLATPLRRPRGVHASAWRIRPRPPSRLPVGHKAADAAPERAGRSTQSLAVPSPRHDQVMVWALTVPVQPRRVGRPDPPAPGWSARGRVLRCYHQPCRSRTDLETRLRVDSRLPTTGPPDVNRAAAVTHLPTL
jgi:hypothetical protein